MIFLFFISLLAIAAPGFLQEQSGGEYMIGLHQIVAAVGDPAPATFGIP